MAKTRLAVIFGSRSVEHEVSVITGQQIMAAADSAKYDVVPVYITKEGAWLTGAALADLDTFRVPGRLERAERAFLAPEPGQRGLVRAESGLGLFRRGGPTEIDVAFPAVHGTYGEDGTLQGLLELADVPYVGAGVAAASVGMDKILTKAAFRAAGLPVIDGQWYSRSRFQADPEAVLAGVEQSVGYPAFVKPAVLGSSIGVACASNRDDLRFALEVASSYGRRLLVERALEDFIEVNCAVLGNDDPIPSVCEQPVRGTEVLSYADKYLRGTKAPGGSDAGAGPASGQAGDKLGGGMQTAQRLIPAPIPDDLTARIQALAVAAFRAIDGAGIARVDFLLTRDGEVYVNEINTLPGSLSFYLWEPSGVSFPQLIDRLVALALERHADRQRTTYSYDSDLLQRAAKPAASGPKQR
jgi:D-alanine-D-alanine ligase